MEFRLLSEERPGRQQQSERTAPDGARDAVLGLDDIDTCFIAA
jgi:hypothetical protein